MVIKVSNSAHRLFFLTQESGNCQSLFNCKDLIGRQLTGNRFKGICLRIFIASYLFYVFVIEPIVCSN
jgi:hypothetical protein